MCGKMESRSQMRKIIFYVQTMCWNQVDSCYFAKELFKSTDYHECEKFCLNYLGPEENIFIQKAFLK